MRHFLSIVFLILAIIPSLANDATSRIDKNLTIYTDVMCQLDINYVDTLNYEQLINTSINAMLRQVDPYTVYIPKSEADNLRMMTQGKYGGIGSVIMQRDSVVVISEPYQHMPAAQAGLLPGDTLITVNEMDCNKKTTKEVSDYLRGNPGTKVHITIKRDGQIIHYEITRRDIHLPAVTYSAVYQDTIAYIALAEFTQNSAQEFLIALDQMVQSNQVKRLIIDLRGNGGGLIDEAVQILGFFLPKDTEVVSTKGKIERASHSYTTRTTPIFPTMPIVVMVDKHSASASEIVAGALQDLKRATIIGQRTFGKGLVQNLRPISYGGHLKVTTSKYYLPSGRCIQAIDYAERQKGNQLHRDTAGGILPDIVLSDSNKIDICYNLYRDQLFFDYATLYHRRHLSIAPATEFTIQDADIEDFCKFLDDKQFKYETETGRYFKELLEVATNEDIDSTLLAELKTLQPQFTMNYRQAIERNRTEIEEWLGGEIVKRYHYQRGYHAYMLRFDQEFHRALLEITQR
jgi:carboxyl-terminal processing protease